MLHLVPGTMFGTPIDGRFCSGPLYAIDVPPADDAGADDAGAEDAPAGADDDAAVAGVEAAAAGVDAAAAGALVLAAGVLLELLLLLLHAVRTTDRTTADTTLVWITLRFTVPPDFCTAGTRESTFVDRSGERLRT